MRHLYVHVPFCRRRCSYCDFAIAVRRNVPARAFVTAVLGELARLDLPREALDTLYLGGGTPSLLEPAALADLVGGITTVLPLAPGAEVTLEANPEDVTPATAAAWREAGVSRVSLGAQSFDERVLAWMHRSHEPARTGEAVTLLRAAGIANVSLDLIFAVPAELGREWAADLDRALALAPDHLSLYGLTVEERTPLARWVSRGETRLADDDRYATEYLAAHEAVAHAGLEFYEISNAARPGQRSRHNSAYWTGAPYEGLGPSAHSFDGQRRRWNLGAWEAYRRAVAEGRPAVEHEESLTPEQRDLERVYLALRTAEGLDIPSAPDRLRPPSSAWQERGWAVVEGNHLRCTPEGWLRLDALVRDLTGSRGGP